MANNGGTVELNNYLQARGLVPMLSWEDKPDGPRHETRWISQCKIGGEVLGTGTGPKLNVARDAAANEALVVLHARDANPETEDGGDAKTAVPEPATSGLRDSPEDRSTFR
ncbi:hypothetical protein BN946_scf185007.g209 [Trametes cinnabarina]|uniref:DRBM domain-containing protein n=1 Tax=Pycnoporus cinnabarinus TaxID=5643 RepID=A0A060SLN8_PYCCI|nr:hypothetical protein BN946_scf185007.g209 [Trametes cinnabarina]